MFLYKKWGSRETAPFFLLVPACRNGKKMADRNDAFMGGKVKKSSRLSNIRSRKAARL